MHPDLSAQAPKEAAEARRIAVRPGALRRRLLPGTAAATARGHPPRAGACARAVHACTCAAS